MKKHIPNILTLLNLFCGSIAIALVFLNLLEAALILCFLSLLFDMLDGMVARWLKVTSNLGVQLDSLADMVSFGLLPGIILFYFIQRYGYGDNFILGSISAFLVPLSAAVRLARFNIDTKKRDYFYGLPTPAGAAFVFGILWVVITPSSPWIDLCTSPVFLYIVTFLLIVLYHAPLELASLKGGKSAKRFLLLLLFVGLLLFIFQKELTIFIPIILYLILGIIHRVKKIY